MLCHARRINWAQKTSCCTRCASSLLSPPRTTPRVSQSITTNKKTQSCARLVWQVSHALSVRGLVDSVDDVLSDGSEAEVEA